MSNAKTVTEKNKFTNEPEKKTEKLTNERKLLKMIAINRKLLPTATIVKRIKRIYS